MRLVVDTNVFVSAALKEASWPAQTLRWIGKYGGLLKSNLTGIAPSSFSRMANMLDEQPPDVS